MGKTAVFDIEKAKKSIQLNTLLSILDILNIQMKLEPPFPPTNDYFGQLMRVGHNLIGAISVEQMAAFNSQ